MRNPLILVLCLLPVAAFAQAPALDLDGGWQEAVVSVPDAGRAAAFYQAVGGWTVHYDGAVDASQLFAWGLPEAASAREIVLGNPGISRNGAGMATLGPCALVSTALPSGK